MVLRTALGVFFALAILLPPAVSARADQPDQMPPGGITVPTQDGVNGDQNSGAEESLSTDAQNEPREEAMPDLRTRVEAILAQYRIGAEAGDPTSMYILAHGLLLTGHQREGIGWMEKAAARREPRAQAAMGQFHQYGDFGVAQDYELAADLYAAAAEQGDLDGMFGLAFLYELGRGVEWNIEKAEELYARAANKGHDLAQFTLARIHLLGQVHRPDYVTSYKWLKILTEQADTMAELKNEANTYLGEVRKLMQPGEIVEGEAAAKAWLRRRKPPARKPKGLVIP